MKNRVTFALPFVGALLLAVCGAYSGQQYRRYHALETQHRNWQNVIRKADLLNDPQEAMDLYKTLPPAIPEVRLRILQRQWAIALDSLQRINRVKFNRTLQSDVAPLLQALQKHLDEMKERANGLLAEPAALRQEIAWRAYNLAGAVKLFTAFLVLETERNAPKAGGLLKEAIADYKAAIQAVDASPGSPREKNIPRWNLELLYARQQVSQLNAAKAETDPRLDLQESLEVLIPEKGGYAPGEPVETRIKK